ncbi:hypothetical protein AKJ16_DCAP12362 [Drosera capensis]
MPMCVISIHLLPTADHRLGVLRPTLHRSSGGFGLREGGRDMSSLGTAKGLLEVGKFAVYVSVPIALMYVFANNNKNLQRIMGNRSYVVYPPEGPPPPSPEELREVARELAAKRSSRMKRAKYVRGRETSSPSSSWSVVSGPVLVGSSWTPLASC